MDLGIVDDHFQGLAVALGRGVADKVDGVVERRVGRQEFLHTVDGGIRQPGHVEAGLFRGVGGQDAGAAGVGDDAQAWSLGQGLGGEGLGQVEQRGHVVGPDDAGLAEGGGIGLVRAGDGAGVGGGGLGAGGGGAGLDHDDRLFLGDLGGLLNEVRAVLDVLDVAEDDRGVGVGAQVLQHVAFVDDGFVAKGHELGEPDVFAQRPVENGGAQRPGLGEKRDGAFLGVAGGERSVVVVVGADEPQAVGADHGDLVLGAQLDQALLQGIAFLAHFLEARGDDDGRAHLALGQGFHGRHDGGHGHDDDGHVQAFGQVLDLFGDRQAEDLVGLGVHGNQRALVPGLQHVGHDRVADLARSGGGPDDGYGFGREQRVDVVFQTHSATSLAKLVVCRISGRPGSPRRFPPDA